MATVYLFNDEGYFIGVGESIPHPFNAGEDSLPNNSTYLEIPEEKEGNVLRHYEASGELPERWSYEKILTEAEQKVAGELSLVDGEYVEAGELIVVEAPSILHTWNKDNHTWEVDAIKVERLRQEKYIEVSQLRETTLETGYYFEEGKLIKGRDRDLTRAQVTYTVFKDNLLSEAHNVGGALGVTWTFSNMVQEVITTLDRMKVVFMAASAFVSMVCNIDGMLKLEIHGISDWESLLAYDTQVKWNEKYNELYVFLVPTVETTTTTEETTTV